LAAVAIFPTTQFVAKLNI